MRAGMGGAPREMAPRLPLSQSQPLRTLKSCAGIVIVSVKVWLLRRCRPAQGFFERLIAEGETMITLACMNFDVMIQQMMIFLGVAVGLGALLVCGITFFIIKIIRSVETE